MNSTDPNLVQTALELLQAGVVTNTTKEGNEYLVIPANAQVFDLEKLSNAPRRIREQVGFSRFVSFCAYVNEFKNESTKIFMSVETGLLSARLDYHGRGQPSWNGHQASHHPMFSEEWRIWHGKNGQAFDQKNFALFLEDNAVDVIEPAAAEMLDISRNLSAKINVNFKKGVRLEDGTEQLQYEESVDANCGRRGEFKVPSAFKLFLSVWEGRERRALTARLRYAIKEGVLSFHYSLVRPRDVLRAEIDLLAAEVLKTTGIAPLAGGLAP